MPKLSKTDRLYKAFEDAWERFYKKCGEPQQFKAIETGKTPLSAFADIINFAYPLVDAALSLKKNGPQHMTDEQAKKYVLVLQDLDMQLTSEIMGEPDIVGWVELPRKERWYVRHDQLLRPLLSPFVGKERRKALDLLRIKKHAGALAGACEGCIDSVNHARRDIQNQQVICAIMKKEGAREDFYKGGYKKRLVK